MPQHEHFIVLSGEAGAGKDSLANILVGEHGYVKLSLAFDMKVFCMNVFGWTHEQVFGKSSLRNEPDPRWARPCPNCMPSTRGRVPRPDRIVCRNPDDWIECPSCRGTGQINDNSPRRVLQLLGDEWARQMIHPDILTMAIAPTLERRLVNGERIVIIDARFENDRTNLRSWFGARLVDVRYAGARQPKDDGAAWRQHGSERSRPTDDLVDYVVHNDERWPFPSMSERCRAMLGHLYPYPKVRISNTKENVG